MNCFSLFCCVTFYFPLSLGLAPKLKCRPQYQVPPGTRMSQCCPTVFPFSATHTVFLTLTPHLPAPQTPNLPNESMVVFSDLQEPKSPDSSLPDFICLALSPMNYLSFHSQPHWNPLHWLFHLPGRLFPKVPPSGLHGKLTITMGPSLATLAKTSLPCPEVAYFPLLLSFPP